MAQNITGVAAGDMGEGNKKVTRPGYYFYLHSILEAQERTLTGGEQPDRRRSAYDIATISCCNVTSDRALIIRSA